MNKFLRKHCATIFAIVLYFGLNTVNAAAIEDAPLAPLQLLRGNETKEQIEHAFDDTFTLICLKTSKAKDLNQPNEWICSTITPEIDSIIATLTEGINRGFFEQEQSTSYLVPTHGMMPHPYIYETPAELSREQKIEALEEGLLALHEKIKRLKIILDAAISTNTRPEIINDAQLLKQTIEKQCSWRNKAKEKFVAAITSFIHACRCGKKQEKDL